MEVLLRCAGVLAATGDVGIGVAEDAAATSADVLALGVLGAGTGAAAVDVDVAATSLDVLARGAASAMVSMSRWCRIWRRRCHANKASSNLVSRRRRCSAVQSVRSQAVHRGQ